MILAHRDRRNPAFAVVICCLYVWTSRAAADITVNSLDPIGAYTRDWTNWPQNLPYGDFDPAINSNRFVFSGLVGASSGTVRQTPLPGAAFAMAFTGPFQVPPSAPYLPPAPVPGWVGNSMWIAAGAGGGAEICAIASGTPFPLFGPYGVYARAAGWAYFPAGPADVHIQIASGCTDPIVDLWINYIGPGGGLVPFYAVSGIRPVVWDPNSASAELRVYVYGGPAALYFPKSADYWLTLIPEPLTAVMVGLGLAGVGLVCLRRRVSRRPT